MTLDRHPAIADRPPVTCPQRFAPRTPAFGAVPAATPMRQPVRGTGMHAPGRPLTCDALPPGTAWSHGTFRFPVSTSNDSAGSDDASVAGLEGAQTWASR